MSDNKTIENVHVHIYGHEMLGEVISRARKNNIPYDKEMQYDFHSHGHSYLVMKDGELTLLEDPSEKHGEEISLNGFFEIYLSKEEKLLLTNYPTKYSEINIKAEVGKWYINNYGSKYLAYAQELKGTIIIKGYGFDDSGNWEVFAPTDASITECREATPQEVEKALIEEAKRRGHAYNEYDYNPEENELCGINNGRLESVFCDGHWEQPTDKFAELKEAHSKGAVIESMPKKWIGDWTVATNPIWDGDNYEYRIKPEEKPKAGDVVKAWDSENGYYTIGVIKHIEDWGYFLNDGMYWDNAKTLTQQEAIELLFGKENVDD